MAAAYERQDCLCGGIFGTGTNGAYVEQLAKITKMGKSQEELEKAKSDGLDYMVVNTECENTKLMWSVEQSWTQRLTLSCIILSRGSIRQRAHSDAIYYL